MFYLIISIALGILLNLIFLLAITWNQGKDSSGWQQAEEVAAALSLSRGGAMFSQRKERRYWSRREPGGSWWRMIQEM